MKVHRLLIALAAVLITAGQALIFAVDTASTAHVAAPPEASVALHATPRRLV